MKSNNENKKIDIQDLEALYKWLSDVSQQGMTTISVDLVRNKLRGTITKIKGSVK